MLSGSSPDTVSARAGLHRGTAESRDGSGQSEVDRPLVGPGRERCSGGRYAVTGRTWERQLSESENSAVGAAIGNTFMTNTNGLVAPGWGT